MDSPLHPEAIRRETSVLWIAEDGKIPVSQVEAGLVRDSRHELDPQEREFPVPDNLDEMRQRGFPVRGRVDAVFCRVFLDRDIDSPGGRRFPEYNGQVGLLYQSGPPCFLQSPERRSGKGDRDQARCVPVQAVHRARPEAVRGIGEAVPDSTYKAVIAGSGRLDQKSRRFVKHPGGLSLVDKRKVRSSGPRFL